MKRSRENGDENFKMSFLHRPLKILSHTGSLWLVESWPGTPPFVRPQPMGAVPIHEQKPIFCKDLTCEFSLVRSPDSVRIVIIELLILKRAMTASESLLKDLILFIR